MRSPVVRLSRARALATAAALAAVLAAALGAGAAAPARAMGPLPACRYDDVLTAPRRYVDWSVTLVDTILRVPSTYVPPDLVSTSEAGIAGGGQVRAVALADLTALTAAASAAGNPIAVQSAYRSYTQQKATFDHWVDVDGYKGALKVSARPGHSEHQLGLAIDFKSDDGGPPWEGSDWAQSPAGAWMKANAWRYGWVLSYPKNDFTKVCYSYEPWHYRYVGRDLAALIHHSGLTTREYLWTNFTTATVPPPTSGKSPAPGGSASSPPSASPSMTVAPSLEPTLEPTLAPTPSPTVSPTLGPIPTTPPQAASDSFGISDPLVGIGAIVAAIAALVAGWWFVGRGARGRRGPSS
ncbi:MAG TPA: M15 family metallopeptidase [Candidatus Limnocylindrales bacterium]